MKSQRIILITILVVILIAILVIVSYFGYKQYSAPKEQQQIQQNLTTNQQPTQTSINNTSSQTYVPLLGFNFLLPSGWQAKSINSSGSAAIVVDSTNTQFTMSMQIVKSYQDFGSGKYNITPIQTGGSIWNEVATASIIPIGIDLYGHSVGPYYNFVADFGDSKVPTGDYDQIFSMVKNASPFIGYGNYQFEEFAQPNQDWMYNFSIIEAADGHGIPATLNIDGFQTQIRIVGHMGGNNGNTEFIFDSYGPDNTTGQQFKKGDILFLFTPVINDDLSIQWEKLQPNLKTSRGGAIFKKVPN